MLLRTVSAFVVLACGFLDAHTPAAASEGARAVSINGQVSISRNGQAWAVSTGDWIPGQQAISTGSDGFARFRVAGGSTFEIFNNSRVIFRQDAVNSGDLLNVIAGRVRVHLQPEMGRLQLRIFCPVASIVARERATLALAIDEDDAVRIDVVEGSVRVQHALLPQKEPVLITAVDAILVRRDEGISRRLDHGSLYRYTARSIRGVVFVLTLGHSGPRGGEAEFRRGSLLARAISSRFIQNSGA